MRRSIILSLSMLLALAACSGNPEPAATGASPAPATATTPAESPTPEVELPEGVNPFPLGVASQENQRYAATGFDPVFTFEGQPGMPFPWFGEVNEPGWVEFHSEESALLFLRPVSVHDEAGDPGKVPADLASWFAGREELDVRATGEAHLAGLDGTLIEATVTDVLDDQPAYCEVPCLPLLTIDESTDPLWIPKGQLLVIRVFDLDSGPLVVLVDTTRDNWSTLKPHVDGLLDSVRFLDPAA